MKRILALVACAWFAGCFPVVQHGPWVRPGMSGAAGGTGALIAPVGNDAEGFAGYLNFDGGLRIGVPFNRQTQQGISFGAQLPLTGLLWIEGDDDDDLLTFINFDGYVSGPMIGGRNTSAGAMVSRYHVTPYVQLGRYDKWYGTLAVTTGRNNTDFFMVAPSYTQLRRLGDRTLAHITYTLGFGGTDSDKSVVGGISIMFEFHGKHARP